MKRDSFSTLQLISDFNHSDFRSKVIPQELVSGWPCLQWMGKSLCITIPYYARSFRQDKVALFPLYCSVTLPVGNPDRLMDYSVYPYQKEWQEIDYTKPVGYFKHAALADVKTKEEYQVLCRRLYDLFDRMTMAVLDRKPFEQEDEMIPLFTKLMEQGHYLQYLKINRKFYSCFCRM
ncbi:MAG: hypothetical protein K2O97_02460 [Acetatifactor sp.]|nr:hypothetical protein [Acetatifactor sp.]